VQLDFDLGGERLDRDLAVSNQKGIGAKHDVRRLWKVLTFTVSV
jgi:hypothetical protein